MLTTDRPRYAQPARRRPTLVEVERHVIVGARMEYQEQVRLSTVDVEAAISFLRMGSCPEVAGIVQQTALILGLASERLVALLALLRAESGELDGLCETGRHAGHGAAA